MPLARHLAVVLATGLALLALPGAASAAVIPVTITEDLTNGGDGECSLFEAVEAAKLNADDGGCDGTGAYGDDTVQLAGLQYQITDGQIALLSGFGELTIDGVPGSTVIHRSGSGVAPPLQHRGERRRRVRGSEDRERPRAGRLGWVQPRR